MSWNEHLSRDERGSYNCSHYKACLDCEYDGACLCQDQIREEIDHLSSEVKQT